MGCTPKPARPASRINHQLTLKYIKLFGLTVDPFEPGNLAQVAYIRERRIKIPNSAVSDKEAKENESDKKNQQ